MSHSANKVEWCLRKAEKELKSGSRHRGLAKVPVDMDVVRAHIKKAEHNLAAITDFSKAGYSDWSASAAFYAIYHCLLAIIGKFGYESRNQECTFALVRSLIEDGKIKLDIRLIDEVSLLDPEVEHELPTIVDVRETGQYGVKLSLETDTFDKLQKTAKMMLDRTKEIIESK